MANKTRAARGLFYSHKETQEDTKNTKNVQDDSGQNVDLDYLKLLDETGRQFRTDKRGMIPATCAPILDRLDCSAETWFDLVKNFRKRFRNEAGSVLSVRSVENAGLRPQAFKLMRQKLV